jgi:hypothetical protein
MWKREKAQGWATSVIHYDNHMAALSRMATDFRKMVHSRAIFTTPKQRRRPQSEQAKIQYVIKL